MFVGSGPRLAKKHHLLDYWSRILSRGNSGPICQTQGESLPEIEGDLPSEIERGRWVGVINIRTFDAMVASFGCESARYSPNCSSALTTYVGVAASIAHWN